MAEGKRNQLTKSRSSSQGPQPDRKFTAIISPFRGRLWLGGLFTLLTLSCLRVPFLLAQGGKVTLEAQVDNPQPALNEKIRLSIKLSWEGKADSYEFSWPEEPECRNLQIVGNSTSNQQVAKARGTTWVRKFDYILRPIEEGEARIEPLSLTYTDLGTQEEFTLKSKPIQIHILPPTRKGRGIPLWFLLGLFMVLGGTSLSALIMRKRRKSPEAPVQEAIGWEEQALRELERIKRERINGDFKAYYSSLAQLVREYLREKYGIRTREVTTYDILTSLRAQGADEEENKAVEEILNQCDLVKFAPQEPLGEDLEAIWLKVNKLLGKGRSNERGDKSPK